MSEDDIAVEGSKNTIRSNGWAYVEHTKRNGDCVVSVFRGKGDEREEHTFVEKYRRKAYYEAASHTKHHSGERTNS